MSAHPLIGRPMPPFALRDASSQLVSSRDLIDGRPLVIYFYPKDDTPGCTVEACGFRDVQEQLAGLGARVIGVSADSPAAHARFAERHGLPFTLLSDPDRQLARAFGVKSFLGLLPGRETFVIDGEGIVRFHLRANVAPRRHVGDALDALRSLANPG